MNVPERPDLPPSPSTLRTRPTLLFRLRNWQDEVTWSEFYQLYHNFVFGLARRSGLPYPDAEEVTQDVFRRVAETIHEFESNPAHGTFRGWLANLTRWRITDKFRSRRPDQKVAGPGLLPYTDDGLRTIDHIADPSASASPWGNAAAEESEWQLHVLDTALARLARQVPAKKFQIFELYTRQNWPVFKIARELGINPASVYLVSHRLTKQLKAEAARVEQQLR